MTYSKPTKNNGRLKSVEIFEGAKWFLLGVDTAWNA